MEVLSVVRWLRGQQRERLSLRCRVGEYLADNRPSHVPDRPVFYRGQKKPRTV